MTGKSIAAVADGARFDAAAAAPESKFLARDGGRIAYDDRGQGPLVVMVPGLGDLRGEYRYLAPLFVAAGYRAVTMDLRGHGQSSIGWADYRASALGDDVLALLRELDAGPALLVGTSMGAAAVVWAAAEAPAQVSGLTLIGPFVREVPGTPWWKAALQRAMIKLAFAGPWAPAAWGSYYASIQGERPGDFEAYRAGLVANLSEPGRMDAVRGMMQASKAEIEARLGEVAGPVLVVMGAADPDFPSPAGEAEAVAKLLKGKVRMVEGAGHYPHTEQPHVVAQCIFDTFGRGNA